MPDAPTAEAAAVEFAGRWALTVAGTSYVLMDLPETQAYLLVLARQLLDVWGSEPFDAQPACRVGAALVDGHFTHPDTISRTLAHMMSGELIVESTPGTGSRFTLWLPSPNSCIASA